MITFEVPDMTCGHCVSTITKALKALDTNARVQIDLATHRVQVEPTDSTEQEIRDAIQEVGYAPVVVDTAGGPEAASGSQTSKGCCCG